MIHARRDGRGGSEARHGDLERVGSREEETGWRRQRCGRRVGVLKLPELATEGAQTVGDRAAVPPWQNGAASRWAAQRSRRGRGWEADGVCEGRVRLCERRLERMGEGAVRFGGRLGAERSDHG